MTHKTPDHSHENKPCRNPEGAKGVGKTATASERARTIFDLSDSLQRETVAAAPGLICAEPEPVLVDEWQPDLARPARHFTPELG
jgi:hypothetical protein